MKHRIDTIAWRDIMPEVFNWIESVNIEQGSGLSNGGYHVVAAKSADDKIGFQLLATDLGDAKSKLEAACQTLSWKPSAGPLAVAVEEKIFLVTPQSSVKVGSSQIARQLGLDVAPLLRGRNVPKLIVCKNEGLSQLDVLDGIVNGLYDSDGLKLNSNKKSKGPKPFPGAVQLSDGGFSDADVNSTRHFARATVFSRFLQDGPPNFIRPEILAQIAGDVAKETGLNCKILDRPAMEELGMGSMLSVSDGGDDEPCTIIIEIEGEDNSKTVALVGKGLTFDAGGISIKPSGGMEEMKYDMCGGGAVLGAAMYFGNVKPPVRVVCLVGASENIPSATATVPGDVVKAMNGKTIEVINTDAEGRLVLADVLCYTVENYKPDLIIDIATLTGAVLHALGSAGSAIMGNDQDSTNFVLQSAESMGEPVWQLPLWPELDLKSDIADLRNIAKPNVKAGSIIGGVFLKEFVGDSKWCHLDIAATGWSCQATGYPSAGGTGYGMRTMVSACERFNR